MAVTGALFILVIADTEVMPMDDLVSVNLTAGSKGKNYRGGI